jgi:plastocyanin
MEHKPSLTMSLVVFFLSNICPPPAQAQSDAGGVEGVVEVRHNGALVDASNVVLYVVGFAESPPKNVVEMRQQDKRFIPDLLPITVGQTVSFPNGDPFFHNVFSPSGVRPFDLGQFPNGETKTKRFPTLGVVEVYCNIHPEMAATILVLPNTRFTRASPDGRFRIDGVPAGHWTLYAFDRHIPSPVSTPIEVTRGATVEIALAMEELRFDFTHPNKYGEKYRDLAKYR